MATVKQFELDRGYVVNINGIGFIIGGTVYQDGILKTIFKTSFICIVTDGGRYTPLSNLPLSVNARVFDNLKKEQIRLHFLDGCTEKYYGVDIYVTPSEYQFL